MMGGSSPRPLPLPRPRCQGFGSFPPSPTRFPSLTRLPTTTALKDYVDAAVHMVDPKIAQYPTQQQPSTPLPPSRTSQSLVHPGPMRRGLACAGGAARPIKQRVSPMFPLSCTPISRAFWPTHEGLACKRGGEGRDQASQPPLKLSLARPSPVPSGPRYRRLACKTWSSKGAQSRAVDRVCRRGLSTVYCRSRPRAPHPALCKVKPRIFCRYTNPCPTQTDTTRARTSTTAVMGSTLVCANHLRV